MRKLITILTFVLGALSIDSQAQTSTGKVNGSVIDGSTKTIESATITLLRVKDSSVIKMGVADKSGKFSFDNVPAGKYFVAISAVGHQKGYSESFEINGSNTAVNLKTIELQTQEKSLSAVTIVAKKPLIEQKIDRTIVNV